MLIKKKILCLSPLTHILKKCALYLSKKTCCFDVLCAGKTTNFHSWHPSPLFNTAFIPQKLCDSRQPRGDVSNWKLTSMPGNTEKKRGCASWHYPKKEASYAKPTPLSNYLDSDGWGCLPPYSPFYQNEVSFRLVHLLPRLLYQMLKIIFHWLISFFF